jgi:uncharacterized repeat protein (TIGR01451 family)
MRNINVQEAKNFGAKNIFGGLDMRRKLEQDAFDLPMSIDKVGKQDIQDGQLRMTLSESLARVPGLTAQNRNQMAQDPQISSRGFGARSSFGVRGIRIYVDGQIVRLDSLRINGGDSVVIMYAGNGQTIRLEADQHPLHPGHSRPNASVENCGAGTWTPLIINTMPQDDADPVIDIYCGQVTAPYDPNDKTGFPLGVGITHNILRNQDIEYLIRFQNIGTDTAFNVVILDTLTTDLDIFSVVSEFVVFDGTNSSSIISMLFI